MTKTRLLAVSVGALLLLAAPPAGAQTITEWSAENRLLLSFHVNDAALQRLLPAGWSSAPSTAPGDRGANLRVVFIDRQIALDGQGKPFRTGTSRYIVLVAPARNAAGEMNTVVVRGLSPEGPGAYGVNLSAVVSTVTRSATTEGEEGGRAEERWQFAAADVVRSASTPDRVESLTFRASGAAFAPLFDGKETLLSVTSLPWYEREVSVP